VRPDLLLDARSDLFRRLGGEQFQEYLHTSVNWGGPDAADWRTSQWEMALGTLRRGLPYAEVFRVTEPMSHIVEALATGMSGIEHVPRRDEIYSYQGLIFFERPLPVYDVRGNRMLVHWLTWAPVNVGSRPQTPGDEEPGEPGFLISMWNDIQVEPDEVMLKQAPTDLAFHLRLLGRWAPMGLDVTTVDARVGPQWVTPDEATVARLIGDGVPPEIAQRGSTNSLRYVVALWTLMNQTLTDLREERPRKRKRFGPQRMPQQESITVITLRRRASDPDHEPSSVEWQHRWLVRGHPRQQRYGPNNAWVRTIWIAPHVKGPEDKPLVITRKVYDLRR
jgi:hypothetical protein